MTRPGRVLISLVVLLLHESARALLVVKPTSRRRDVVAYGKKAKKVDRETAWQMKKEAEAAAKLRRAGRATDLTPAELRVGGGTVSEDHRHEQFFYDDATAARLLSLVSTYEKPLLVCNPSLAGPQKVASMSLQLVF